MIFFLTSPVQKSTGREKCVSAHFLRVILSQDFVCNAMQTCFSETPNVTPTDQGRSPSSRKISVDFPPQTALHCHRMAGWNGMSLWATWWSIAGTGNCTHFQVVTVMTWCELLLVILVMEEFWASNYLGMFFKNRPKIMGVWRISSIKSSKAPKHFGWQVWRKSAQKVEENESTESVCVLCQPNKSLPIASRMTYRRFMCSHFNVGTFIEYSLRKVGMMCCFLDPGTPSSKRKACKTFFGVRWGMLYNFVSLMFLMGLQSVQLFHLPLCSKWNEVEPKPRNPSSTRHILTLSKRVQDRPLCLMVDNRYASHTHTCDMCFSAIPLNASVFHCWNIVMSWFKKEGDVMAFQFFSRVKRYIRMD